MTIETRLTKLENTLIPNFNQMTDYLEWQNLRMAIILDKGYERIPEAEAQRRLSFLGNEPFHDGTVRLCDEMADVLNQVYAQ